MAEGKRATFTPLPVRAIGDQRLTASHFRALGAIGEHDRMSGHRGKGAGCFASNKTLAEKCGINYSNFSTVVSQLGSWGYIVSAPHPISKRTRVYRVIYDDADPGNGLPTGKQSNDIATADSLPTGKSSDHDGGPVDVCATVAKNPLPTGEQSAPILCPPERQYVENVQQLNDKYIPLNGKRFSETVKHSAEAAPVPGVGLRKRADENEGAFLAIIERELRQGEATLDPITERQIERIMDAHQDDDALFHQAERILATWGA